MDILEKDRILLELYAVNNYYKNEAKINKALEDGKSSDYTVPLLFEGTKYKVKSKQNIEDLIIQNGKKFNENGLVLKQIGAKPAKITPPSTSFSDYICGDSITLFFIAGFVLVFVLLFLILGWSADSESMRSLARMIGVIGMLVGVVVLIIGFIPPSIRASKEDEQNENIKKKNAEEISLWENTKRYNEDIILERKNNFKKYYSEEFSALSLSFDNLIKDIKKKKWESVAKIKEIQISFNDVKNNSIVPIFYLNDPNAVNKMLFLMLNKRADTVKELVNLYEQENWQESILAKLDITNQSMIVQSKITLEGLIKTNENISNLIYGLENMQFTTYSYGYIG